MKADKPADTHALVAAAAPGLLLAAVLAAAGGLLAATLNSAERSTLWALLQPRIALLFMLWLAVSIAAGAAARRAWLHFGAAPGRLAEDVQVLVASDTPQALNLAHTGSSVGRSVGNSAGSQALTRAVAALAQQRDGLRADMASQVAAASQQVA